MPGRYRKRVARKPYRRSRPRPQQSLSGMAISALGGYALKKLKDKLGLNTETKYIDFAEIAGTPTTTTLTASGAITNPIPQGDGTNARQGNTLRVTSFQAKYTFRANAASVAASRVRLIIMYQPQLLQPGNIFTAADIVTDTTANIETPYNMNTVGYKILYDKTVEIAAVGQNGSTKELVISYRPLDHHMEWTDADTAGSATLQLRGYMRAYICTDNGTHPPTYSSYSRLKFVDN